MNRDAIELVDAEAGFKDQVYGEIGWGFLKTISRAAKSVGRTVGRAAKSVVRSPLVKTVVGGAAMVMPVLAPVAAGLVAADKVISMAESADKKRREIARSIIKATKKEAKVDPAAKRAFKALKVVYKKKKQLKGMSAKERADRAARLAARERSNRAALKNAKKALQRLRQLEAKNRAAAVNGALVDSRGRITRGRFRKA